MKTQHVLVALTALNLALAAFNLADARPSRADAAPGMLRGRGLEIVDDHGRVRATLSVLPGDPKFRMPDGTVGYPETVLLRLIDQHGRPNIKIGASEKGGGVGVGGERDPTYARIETKGDGASLSLIDRQGRERVLAAP
jgi:hypothetical protein